MKLDSFSVKNYRSILETADICFSDEMTVLVGANNEGKSNLLKALQTAFQTIAAYRFSSIHGLAMNRRYRDEGYDFERDYPFGKQHDANPTSRFRLTFRTEEDDHPFLTRIGNKNCRRIAFNLIFSKKQSIPAVSSTLDDSPIEVEKKVLHAICMYISARLSFLYIPAIRTEEQSRQIVSQIVDNGLETLFSVEKYQDVLNELQDKQRKFLDKQSRSLTKTIKKFIPSVKSIRIETDSASSARRFIHRVSSLGVDLLVDDGVATTFLQQKGDGLISLITLGLMHQSFQSKQSGKFIVGIEEPEAHLHPEAIHALKTVISNIAKDQQVVLSTHSPIMVNMADISSNIIVSEHRPHSATSVRELREVLGVRTSDNLRSTEVVLIVEGEEDRDALKILFPVYAKKLDEALKDNRLSIEILQGATNLPYKIDTIQRSLCKFICLLDNDKAGRTAIEHAKKAHRIQPKDFLYTVLPDGKNESEFEDCINPDVYRAALSEKLSTSLFRSKTFLNGKGNWSNRIKAYCNRARIEFDDAFETELKQLVINSLKEYNAPLTRAGRNLFQCLETRICELLSH